jgi:hypothetical protein
MTESKIIRFITRLLKIIKKYLFIFLFIFGKLLKQYKKQIYSFILINISLYTIFGKYYTGKLTTYKEGFDGEGEDGDGEGDGEDPDETEYTDFYDDGFSKTSEADITISEEEEEEVNNDAESSKVKKNALINSTDKIIEEAKSKLTLLHEFYNNMHTQL